MLGTTKSSTTLWLVLLFPRQLKYNIVVPLLQVKIAKGGSAMYIFRASITTKAPGFTPGAFLRYLAGPAAEADNGTGDTGIQKKNSAG